MSTEEKTGLCDKHRGLLQILMCYGGGVILLPQLRELCALFDYYASGQAVNRAVRALQDGGILTRQTWIDNNSDLLLARKFVLRYFKGCDSQAVATPARSRTVESYIIQVRKVDWLLALAKQELLTTPQEVSTHLQRRACTMFLRLPDLLDYYRQNQGVLSLEYPQTYQRQLDSLKNSAMRRAALAHGVPLPAADDESTLETLQRRSLYITAINSKSRTVQLALFANRGTKANRIVDWAIKAYEWIASLLPYYRATLYVYALDAAHAQALTAAMNAPVSSTTGYLQRRLEDSRLCVYLNVIVRNTNFVDRWCGGVRRTDF